MSRADDIQRELDRADREIKHLKEQTRIQINLIKSSVTNLRRELGGIKRSQLWLSRRLNKVG